MSVASGRSGRLLVLFSLGPHRFALAADFVIEICEGLGTGEPGVTFLHRGQEIPLVDLRARFLLAGPVPAGAVIVARAPGSDEKLALLVDLVDAVLPVGADSVIDLPEPLVPFLGADVEGLCLIPREAAGGPGESAPEVVALLGPAALRAGAASRPEGGVL